MTLLFLIIKKKKWSMVLCCITIYNVQTLFAIRRSNSKFIFGFNKQVGCKKTQNILWHSSWWRGHLLHPSGPCVQMTGWLFVQWKKMEMSSTRKTINLEMDKQTIGGNGTILFVPETKQDVMPQLSVTDKFFYARQRSFPIGAIWKTISFVW